MNNALGIENGLISALLLDGKGGAVELDWEGIRQWRPEQGVLWMHLDRTAEDVQHWLETESQLDELISEAMLAEDTRPRITAIAEGMLLILRGVNLNPGADPEDMPALRMWCTPQKIITLRKFKLFSIHEIRTSLAQGKGPEDTGDFITTLIDGLIERIADTIEQIDEGMDDLETGMMTDPSGNVRTQLSAIRRKAVILRRYLIPQREVFSRLQVEKTLWLTSYHRSCVRESFDKLTRCIEDLDMLKERALVAMDGLETQLSERINRTIYWLTIFTAVFLPLTLLTGMWGMNVGGIPWAEDGNGFWNITLLLGGVGIVQMILFRFMKIW